MNIGEVLNRTDRFAAHAGCKITEVDDKHAVAEMTVTEMHLNGGNVCQGGALFTLADLAFAAVANSHGILSVGVQNSISYIKSAQLGDRLSAECFEQVNHHKLPYCDVRITNQQGEVLACVTGLAYRTRQPYEFNSLM